jgi:hypothetical protein
MVIVGVRVADAVLDWQNGAPLFYESQNGSTADLGALFKIAP